MWCKSSQPDTDGQPEVIIGTMCGHVAVTQSVKQYQLHNFLQKLCTQTCINHHRMQFYSCQLQYVHHYSSAGINRRLQHLFSNYLCPSYCCSGVFSHLEAVSAEMVVLLLPWSWYLRISDFSKTSH